MKTDNTDTHIDVEETGSTLGHLRLFRGRSGLTVDGVESHRTLISRMMIQVIEDDSDTSKWTYHAAAIDEDIWLKEGVIVLVKDGCLLDDSGASLDVKWRSRGD